MNYYDDLENVLSYIAMSADFNGHRLVEKLRAHLPQGASLLELGMGAGKDFELLSEYYQAIGSDLSAVFVNLYQEKHPLAKIVSLDAHTLEFRGVVDGLYSNKVLHHLSRSQLKASIVRQHAILKVGGIAMHSFWSGSGEETHNGLLYAYYNEAELRFLFQSHFEIIEMARYNEMQAGDSIYVILRRIE